jgi:hypothetical protein
MLKVIDMVCKNALVDINLMLPGVMILESLWQNRRVDSQASAARGGID